MATGRVAKVEETAPAFGMTVSQSPYPGAPPYPIFLRAIIPTQAPERPLLTRVPPIDHFVTFSGIIHSVQYGSLSIAVDDLAYLPRSTKVFIYNTPHFHADTTPSLEKTKTDFEEID